jgi:hypothetical protein
MDMGIFELTTIPLTSDTYQERRKAGAHVLRKGMVCGKRW